jgi:hypothetical protein
MRFLIERMNREMEFDITNLTCSLVGRATPANAVQQMARVTRPTRG